MTAPRRPRTARPSAAARAGARRSAGAAPRRAGRGSPGSRSTRPARPATGSTPSRATRGPGARTGSPLTSRAALLGLVVCTLVFSAVLPLKTFLAQRAEIASMEQEQAAARDRVAALEEAKRRLEDPEFVAAEARRRLHMARPGEVSYVLIAPPGAAEAELPGQEAPDGGPDAPWWSQVWASVHEADRAPVAEPAP